MSFFDVLFGWMRGSGGSEPDIATDSSALSADQTGNSAAADRIPVILTGFTGNQGIKAAKVVTRLLKPMSVLGVRRSSQRIEIDYGNSASVLRAMDLSRDAIAADHAQLAICGVATRDGAAVALWLVGPDEEPESIPGVFGADDAILIGTDYPAPAQMVIAGSVAAAVAAVSPVNAKKASSALRHYADAVTPLLSEIPSEIPASHRPGILTAIGNILATRARQTRDVDLYARAVDAYRQAGEGLDPAMAPLSWAGARRQRAIALQAKAALESGKSSGDDGVSPQITEALKIYDEIRTTLSAETAPRAWGQAQIDFGMLTYRQAVKAGDEKPFRDALQALQAAQTAYSRQTMPTKWSEIMNNMGVILLAMGESRGDDGILRHAITSFEQAIQYRPRKTSPKLWAQTSNNLGAAAFALAKRTLDKDILSGAARNFEGAKEVYEELGQSQRAHVIEKNLNRVRRLIETN